MVINGNYIPEPDRKVHFDDSKIHCVYAGTFNRTKGGAITAISLAEFLPSNYHIHILGFGTHEETREIQSQILEVQKISKCAITYDGLLRGEEFIRFLQSCQIGLCTQAANSKYIETSFPSKILVYMANGLHVVCADIPAVKESCVGEYLHYYQKADPKEIANVIRMIDINRKYDSRNVLESARIQFEKDIMSLIK